MKRRISLGILALALVVNLAIGCWVYSREVRKTGGDSDVLKQLGMLVQVLQLIRQNYVDIDKVTSRQLMEGALNGMTSALDPFSQYLPPSDLQELMEDSEGQFGGIGVTVNAAENGLVVEAVTQNAPAAKAGLEVNDLIIAVDDQPVTNGDFQNSLLRIRGKPGTRVKITVRRGANEEVFHYDVERALIPMPNVTCTQMIPDTSVGFVRIEQFMEPTAGRLQESLMRLEAKGMTALILDLRGNPGGLLDSAVEICSMFLPPGSLVVSIMHHSDTKMNRESENFQRHYARAGYRVPDYIPVAVLVDSESASASEITAACLQDHRRAILVGEKTYGKGSVQDIIDLADGCALKLTVARYYTMDKGRPTIDKHGVKPDVEVKLGDKERIRVFRNFAADKIDPQKDLQLGRALEEIQKRDPMGRRLRQDE
ncbi:MAG: S41 family peptidase [Victivallales bacterium]|nr:S41 family peptidase [Victivallales bacterium]